LLAKQSVLKGMGVGNSFLRLRSSKQPLAEVLLGVAKMKDERWKIAYNGVQQD